MFAFYRRVPQLVRAQAESRWDRFIPRVLDGRTATILGMGAIAEHLAGVLKAFGMRVVGVTRTPRPVAGFDRVYPREELIAAVGEADFLVSLLPLSPETRRLVGADVFRAMRADAVFINVSRGGVVDEAALIAALREGRIAGAGLDVFEERVLPAGSPLWTMPNVFITPHIGGRSDRYAEGAMKVLLPNIGAFLRGDHAAMLNRVN
nr:D-2-hydroxyacid dehydrogenase [Propylenella binzhouense]